MHPVLQSCDFLLKTARDFIAGVRHFVFSDMGAHASDYLHTKAAAGRLAAGLRLAEAYLRRVLIIMALELEPTLVDVPQKNLERRERDRPLKIKAKAGPSFVVLPKVPALTDAALSAMQRRDIAKSATFEALGGKKPVFVGRLKARLENLAKIAADPLARAQRLAFHLARKRHGRIIAPDGHLRAPSRMGRMRRLWNMETSASYKAMGYDLRAKSERRPPPLAPLLKYGPSILVLGG